MWSVTLECVCTALRNNFTWLSHQGNRRWLHWFAPAGQSLALPGSPALSSGPHWSQRDGAPCCHVAAPSTGMVAGLHWEIIQLFKTTAILKVKHAPCWTDRVHVWECCSAHRKGGAPIQAGMCTSAVWSSERSYSEMVISIQLDTHFHLGAKQKKKRWFKKKI